MTKKDEIKKIYRLCNDKKISISEWWRIYDSLSKEGVNCLFNLSPMKELLEKINKKSLSKVEEKISVKKYYN